MRLILTVSLAIAGLAACSESDEAFRARYRTEAVATCVQGARSSPNAALVNADRLCGCMVDRYMADTASDRLKAERSQSEPPAGARAAMEQCAREAMTGPQAPAAPTPTPTP